MMIQNKLLINNPLQCYAKSYQNTYKTLEEHIKDLYNQLDIIKQAYHITDEELLFLLSKAVEYHDYGKANFHFQNKILAREKSKEEIDHHFLSPILFLIHEPNLDNIHKDIIMYAIINHHARRHNILFEPREIKNLLNSIRTLKNQRYIYDDAIYNLTENEFNNINEAYKNFFKNYSNFLNSIKKMETDKDKKVIITTGLLIKLDHSASADFQVEQVFEENREKLFLDFLERNGKERKLRDFQEKFKNKNNAIIVADTGIGKTGLACVWSKRKLFYVLPNQSSVNAMYETLSLIFGKDNVGLLHSNSLFYLLKKEEDEKEEDEKENIENILKNYYITKMLSKPVIVTTADQLFLAVFKYPTYERIYATLAYSDIVIDEIQGFDVEQLVPMLHQIEETIKLGARYLIITATLPGFLKNKFEEMNKRLEKNCFEIFDNESITIDNTKRHKVKILDKSIQEIEEEIIEQAKKNNNILVIANTVSTAQEIFQNIRAKLEAKNENWKEKVHLLHRKFILKDRKKKEAQIIKDFREKKGIIWVTTQIVEASLDIDFDILFTEAAPADSLIQRMGRIWRHKMVDYSQEKHNVYILKKIDEHKNQGVYKINYIKETIKKIEELLQNKQDDFLTSQEKRDIVQQIYSQLPKKEWEEEEETLKKINLNQYAIDFKKEAQENFRNIHSVEIIPYKFQEQVQELEKKYKKAKDKIQKIKILMQIQEYTVPVELNFNIKLNKLYILGNVNYDENLGIIKKNENYEML